MQYDVAEKIINERMVQTEISRRSARMSTLLKSINVGLAY